MEEIWKPIPIEQIKKTHEISNYGLVRYKKNGKIIPRTLRSGYPSLIYTVKVNGKRKKKGKKVHILVGIVFVENKDPENLIVVNHLNGDKFDCRASNLEWTTVSGNNIHALETGLRKQAKNAVIQYDLETNDEIKRYESIQEAAIETNINETSIGRCCNGKRNSAGGFAWKYVEENPNKQTDVDLSKYKQIVGFPKYVINNEGKIYSLQYHRFMKFQKHQEGGLMVQLVNVDKSSMVLMHRLVGSYFLKKKDSAANSIRHIDGDKTNNDVSNLKWCYVAGVEAPEIHYNTPYYDPQTAVKLPKRKSTKSAPKDLLSANPKNLSKKQREERKKMLAKQKSGSKTSKPKQNKSGSKTSKPKKQQQIIDL